MNEKKQTILLVDGHSIVNRAFYGIPDLTNSEGLHTNAIYGFLNIFFNAYEKWKPEYVLVAFDVKAKTFRHEMYPDYKGTRKSMPEELHEQVPVLKQVLESMQIRTVELPGFEADDVIGTYARKAEAEGLDVVVLSGDRDLLQLASEQVLVVIPKTKGGRTEIEPYFAADVKAKYQVTPKEFIDLKALMGDSSDNIPGIPGIGEKTATSIIVQYGSLENAFAHAEEVKPPRASKNLQEFIEQGRMSRKLAEIDTDAPVPVDFHDADIQGASQFYNDASYALYKKLELKKLLERFEHQASSNADDIAFETGDAAALSNGIAGALKDTLALEKGCGVFLDEENSLLALTSELPDGNVLTRIFETPNLSFSSFYEDGITCYVFGLKKLLHTLHADGTVFDKIHDMEIMSYLLDPLAPGYAYDQVAKDRLGQLIPSKEELLGKKTFSDMFCQEETKKQAVQYAVLSSRTAYLSYAPLQESLKEQEMWDLYLQVELPLVYALYHMEMQGIGVNRVELAAFSEELAEKISGLEQEIYEEAGEEFNINSPKQLGVILFEKLKLPHGKKTKTGYSTSADVLDKLAVDFPFVSKILEYRQAAKLKSTYADGLAAYIADDNRIHGTFNQTITATGRISSTEPNLQNIPIRTELGQGIRKAFVAKEGYVFLDADYSQIELRLLAHLSGDENLIEAYNSEEDIHKMTASKVFHTPLEEVTKEQRRNAKAVNFGIVYGISSFGLSQGLSISRKEAAAYIEQYFETYPKVKEFLDRTVKQAKMDGYTSTMFGRRRPIPELASSNFMQRSFGERAAMNAPIQGAAADIIKIAMLRVEDALQKANLDAKIVLQVHDELLVECSAADAKKAAQIMKNEMQHAAELKVPLLVEVEEGKDWFEAH